MSFYDHWQTDRTLLGKRWSRIASTYALELASKHAAVSSVLEIGPGNGDFAWVCRNRGAEYTAIDSNADRCQYMSSENYEVIQALVPPLPVEDGTYDMVYASHVLEHMKDWPSALEFVAECGRVTKMGGVVVLVTPDFLKLGPYFWDVEYSHGFVTTPRRVSQLLMDTGLSPLAASRVSGPFHGVAATFSSNLARFLHVGLAYNATARLIQRERFYKMKGMLLGGTVTIGGKRE